MNQKTRILVGLVVVVLVWLMLCQGCTMRFKALEVDFESEASRTYELEKADILYAVHN